MELDASFKSSRKLRLSQATQVASQLNQTPQATDQAPQVSQAAEVTDLRCLAYLGCLT